jgi:FKBP-type peptidyl-prolyl cis-trans isomerase
MRKILFVVLGCLVLFSCENKYKGFEKTENGLYYRFFTEDTIRYVPENDDIIYLAMSIRTENDSIIAPHTQWRVAMKPLRFKGDFFEALSLMHEGDSAEFIINAKNYYEHNYEQVPDFVKDDKTMLWFIVKIDSIQNWEHFKTADAEAKLKAKLEAEKNLIESYLEKNNITTPPQASGLYYIETKAGKGNKPAEGQNVWVHYTGRLLDGKVFDSSIERGEPLPFQLGMGRVIKGWDEGIALMKKGGKAILLIPSYLAYGENKIGDIPPNSPLVFEVELVDIK